MWDRFHSISGGQYAELLYKHFGKERVLKELEDFLALPMVQRYGGGIGVTRLIKNYKALEQMQTMTHQSARKDKFKPAQTV